MSAFLHPCFILDVSVFSRVSIRDFFLFLPLFNQWKRAHGYIQIGDHTVLNLCSSILPSQTCTQTHTQEHSSSMTSIFGLCTKQGTNLTVVCCTFKRGWIKHLLSLPWYGFKRDFAESMCVLGVSGFLLLYVSAQLCLHLIRLLPLFLWPHQVVSYVDPISVYPICICMDGLLSLSTWQQVTI